MMRNCASHNPLCVLREAKDLKTNLSLPPPLQLPIAQHTCTGSLLQSAGLLQAEQGVSTPPTGSMRSSASYSLQIVSIFLPFSHPPQRLFQLGRERSFKRALILLTRKLNGQARSMQKMPV